MKTSFLKSRNSKIFAILLILAALAGLSFFDYSFQNKKHTNESVNQMAKKANNSLALTLENKLNDTELILSTIALQASSHENIKDPAVMKNLHNQSIAGNYLNLSITSADGITTYATTLETIDSSKRESFINVMQGKSYLSDQIKSTKNNKNYIVMSVPIWKEKEVVGMVSSTIDMDIFKKFLELSMTEEGQNAILVQQDGLILAKTDDIVNDNYFTGLKQSTFKDDNTLEIVKNNFTLMKSGNIHYTFKEKEQLAYYCPIKNTRWTVVTLFPYHIINTQVKTAYSFTIQFTFKLISLLILALVCIAYYERKATREIKIINSQLDAVIDNTPGCLIMYEYHRHKNIKFLNDEFSNISGYSKEEFENIFENDLFLIIQPDDVKKLIEKIQQDVKEIQTGASLSYSYRIIHKNGETIWVMDRRHLVKDANGKLWFYITLIDINELKKAQERLRISQQRYEMIIEQTEAVVFEWDVPHDHISFSELWEKKFGYELQYDDFLSVTSTYCENISESYLPLLESFITGHRQGQIECKMKKSDGECIWCKISARSINDINGYLLSVYGSIEDIDAMKTRNLLLEERSKIDGLTQVYNKITGENKIEKALKNQPDQNYILFVIDVDDFKNINDTLGHAIGDKVLSSLADTLKHCFRENDIIARVGGDEFVAFMTLPENVSDNFIDKKAEQLHQSILSIRIIDSMDYHITCSIGVAIYPESGKTYEEMFKNADNALYKAKDLGKDRCCIFKD